MEKAIAQTVAVWAIAVWIKFATLLQVQYAQVDP